MKRKKPESERERLSLLAESFVRGYMSSKYNSAAEAINAAYASAYRRGQREHTGWV
jgi:hypothetical protein